MTLPVIKVLVDFNATAETNNLFFNDLARGLFDTGEFAAANEGIDIAAYVRSGSIVRGAGRVDGPSVRYDAGTLTLVLDNSDRRFDPSNLSGPYASGGTSQVTPMRKVRVSIPAVEHFGSLFVGYVNSWTLNYPSFGADATVTLTATDGTKVLAAFDGAEQAAQGAGETTFARIERIADRVGFPDTNGDGNRVHTSTSLGPARTTCQATTLATNAWTEMLLTADTELGELYFDKQGRLAFHGRHYLYENVVNAAVVYGDGAGEIAINDIAIDFNDDQVYNDISISRTGGTAQTAVSATSQQQYLTHSWGRTDLVHQTDAESLLFADYVLALSKDPHLAVQSITLNAQDPDPLVAYYSAYNELGLTINVKVTPPGGGSRIERRAVIRGIEHTFDPTSWTTRWTLEDAARYAAFVFDSTTNGVLDTNWFAY